MRFSILHDRAFFEALATPHKEFHPTCPYHSYLARMGECEIAYMPLLDTPFNRAKSDLKFLEAAAARLAPLASETVYGASIDCGHTGFLFRNGKELYWHLLRLAQAPELACRVAEAARVEIAETRMLAYQTTARIGWYRSLWARRVKLTAALFARVPEVATMRPIAARSDECPRAPPSATVPTVSWASAEAALVWAMSCPNCGSDVPKPLVLAISWETPGHPRRRTHLLRCPDCGCRFFDDQNPPDYAEPSLSEHGRVPFYLQQGAGLSLITAPLARIRKPAGSRYLEVGCGFGFGVHFAAEARSWRRAASIPRRLPRSEASCSGSTSLRAISMPERRRAAITSHHGVRNDRARALSGRFHRAPRLRAEAGRRPGPDHAGAAQIAPSTPPGALVPLLSPGLHLILQDETSLRPLLAGAGFSHVSVEHDSHSLRRLRQSRAARPRNRSRRRAHALSLLSCAAGAIRAAGE